MNLKACFICTRLKISTRHLTRATLSICARSTYRLVLLRASYNTSIQALLSSSNSTFKLCLLTNTPANLQRRSKKSAFGKRIAQFLLSTGSTMQTYVASSLSTIESRARCLGWAKTLKRSTRSMMFFSGISSWSVTTFFTATQTRNCTRWSSEKSSINFVTYGKSKTITSRIQILTEHL